jgi:CheY-like chemotaxis protein
MPGTGIQLRAGDVNPIRVLLVDDSSEVREVYQAALDSEGFAVKAVGSAEEALEVVRDWHPALIISDIFLPGMSGFELITKIRSDFPPPLPVIVAFSGFPDAEDEALRRGAVRFELKPLSFDTLLAVVAESLSGDKPARPPEDDGVKERRASARAIGEATLEAFLDREPDALTRMNRGARALSRFFGHSTAIVLLRRKGRLTVSATSDPRAYPVGDPANDLLGLANDVIDSAATLILPNVHAQALLRRPSRRIGFLACVPYVVADVCVGALCIVDDTSHDLPSSDLAFLEYAAGHAAALVSNPLARPMMDPTGILSRTAFIRSLGFTTEWAIREGAAMGITLVAPARALPPGSCADVFVNLPGPRMLAGLFGSRRIAVFAAADTSRVVRERLQAVRVSLAKSIDVVACAELSFDAPMPRLPPDVVLTWADDLLARAASTGSKRCFSVSAGRTSSRVGGVASEETHPTRSAVRPPARRTI